MRAIWLNRVISLLTFGGIFVAGVLSVSKYLKVIPPCGGSDGCFTVANHPSSMWFGIPVAYIGLLTYLGLAALAIGRSHVGILKDRRLVMGGVLMAGIGTVVSVCLTVYSLTVIHKTCQWCLASAGIMVVTFLLSAVLAQEDVSDANTKGDSWFFPAICAMLAIGGVGYMGVKLKKEAADTGLLANVADDMSFEQLAPPTAPSIGNRDAPVTVVEFADLTCGACKESYVHMRELYARYQGKLRWVFRHFPLYTKDKQHRFALPAALMAEVAGESGKLWPFVDAAYGLDQEKIESMEPFLAIAGALGMDIAETERRISNPDDPVYDRVQGDISFADRLGVSMTPTFFILIKGQKPIPANVNTYKEILNSPEAQKYLGAPIGQ